MSLSHFDERSGIVPCLTPWGKWWQTISEVFIEINVPKGTRGRQCNVSINPKCISVSVSNEEKIKGNLYKTVITDSSTWTLEEQSKIVILLTKAEKFTTDNLWESLLEGEYIPNPFERLEILKKLDLEKFQIENPGFDFSGAQLSKTYDSKI